MALLQNNVYVNPKTGLAAFQMYVQVPDGTTTTPSVCFTTSNSSGLSYSSGAVRLSVGGTQQLAVSSTALTASGGLLSSGTGGIGYATGSGGAVTQTTSRTTGVTLNKTNGSITLVSAAGTATWQSFTVTNSTVAATDTIQICQQSGTDLYQVDATAVAAGSFRISFATTGGTTTEQPVFNFVVIKAVNA